MRCLPACFLMLAGLVATPAPARSGAPSKGPPTEVLIEHAEDAVADGQVDPQRDLTPLLERLAASRDESEQHRLITTIESLGEYDGASPADVKRYLRNNAPPVLLDVARGRFDWSVRSEALMSLRSLNVRDSVLDEAIAIADADGGPQAEYFHSRADLLRRWKEARPEGTAAETGAQPESSADEQRALAFLRAHHHAVSADSLGQAALAGETDVVAALLDAGIPVNAPLGGQSTPLGHAGGLGCAKSGDNLTARLATIQTLLRRGADVKRKDERGNTVLMSAVQGCTLPVVRTLVEAGAEVNPVNAQGFTPLQMAFVSGKWDIAEFLVDKGARLSRKTVDTLFFEKPTDPGQLALLRRATGGK